MPTRTPRTRSAKPRFAKGTAITRRARRDKELRSELEGLYALDATSSSMSVARPSKARWLRRVALLAPVAVAVQVLIVLGIPFFTKLWNRPEFLVFRLGE